MPALAEPSLVLKNTVPVLLAPAARTIVMTALLSFWFTVKADWANCTACEAVLMMVRTAFDGKPIDVNTEGFESVRLTVCVACMLLLKRETLNLLVKTPTANTSV